MKVVYTAHPFSADNAWRMEHNRDMAKQWMAWALRQGVAPVAPWIPLTSVIAETPETRKLGLVANAAVIGRCDELWLCGPHVSEGMWEEERYARESGVAVVDHTGNAWPPEDG